MKHWPIWMDGLAIEFYYKWMECFSEAQLDDLQAWPCVSNTGTSAWRKIYSCIWHQGKWEAPSLTSDRAKAYQFKTLTLCHAITKRYLQQRKLQVACYWRETFEICMIFYYWKQTICPVYRCVSVISCCAMPHNQLCAHFNGKPCTYILCTQFYIHT